MEEANKTVSLIIITAQSADGFNNAPDIHNLTIEHNSLKTARQSLQMRIGDILRCETNHIEWIMWDTHSIEVKYNNKGAGENTIRSTVRMYILYGRENGKIDCLEIGG